MCKNDTNHCSLQTDMDTQRGRKRLNSPSRSQSVAHTVRQLHSLQPGFPKYMLNTQKLMNKCFTSIKWAGNSNYNHKPQPKHMSKSLKEIRWYFFAGQYIWKKNNEEFKTLPAVTLQFLLLGQWCLLFSD